MKGMKRITNILLLIGIILYYSISNSFAAVTVDVTFDSGGAIDAAVKSLIEAEVHNLVDKYADMSDFSRGFGNASIYASHASTLRGYQGYDLFAVSVGTMASVQAPDDSMTFYEDIPDDIDNGDVYAGVGFNPVVGQMGINLGFIIDGLYMSFKFGKFNYELDQSDYRVDYNSSLIGVLVDYQIIRTKSILARALLWRGFNIESGFIYSNSNIVYSQEIDSFEVISGGYTALIDPSINLEMDVSTYVIPLEIYTSFRLFWTINIGVGGGFDYAWGKTDLTIHSDGSAVITAPAAAEGTITIDASTKDIEPDSFRPKLTANAGLSIGPVFIDVPASYYLDNGYAIGLTAGFAW